MVSSGLPKPSSPTRARAGKDLPFPPSIPPDKVNQPRKSYDSERQRIKRFKSSHLDGEDVMKVLPVVVREFFGQISTSSNVT